MNWLGFSMLSGLLAGFGKISLEISTGELVLLIVALALTAGLIVFFVVFIIRQDKAERNRDRDENDREHDDRAR